MNFKWIELIYISITFVGYYCPSGSAEPTPCPQGRYNPNFAGGSIADCPQCPIDHFNHLTGQKGCFSCGGEAYQDRVGQPTCKCTGAGRDFQVRGLFYKLPVKLNFVKMFVGYFLIARFSDFNDNLKFSFNQCMLCKFYSQYFKKDH